MYLTGMYTSPLSTCRNVLLNVSIGQNLWKRNRSIKIFLMEKYGICKGAKGSLYRIGCESGTPR